MGASRGSRVGYTPPPGKKPEVLLAELIKRKLDVDLDAECVEHFVEANWEQVSVLAHRIRSNNHPGDDSAIIFFVGIMMLIAVIIAATWIFS